MPDKREEQLKLFLEHTQLIERIQEDAGALMSELLSAEKPFSNRVNSKLKNAAGIIAELRREFDG